MIVNSIFLDKVINDRWNGDIYGCLLLTCKWIFNYYKPKHKKLVQLFTVRPSTKDIKSAMFNLISSKTNKDFHLTLFNELSIPLETLEKVFKKIGKHGEGSIELYIESYISYLSKMLKFSKNEIIKERLIEKGYLNRRYIKYKKPRKPNNNPNIKSCYINTDALSIILNTVVENELNGRTYGHLLLTCRWIFNYYKPKYGVFLKRFTIKLSREMIITCISSIIFSEFSKDLGIKARYLIDRFYPILITEFDIPLDNLKEISTQMCTSKKHRKVLDQLSDKDWLYEYIKRLLIKIDRKRRDKIRVKLIKEKHLAKRYLRTQ